MNGRLFAQALCSLQGKDLRTVHVLCCDTGIMDIISTKIQDLLPGDTKHFMQKLEQKVSALELRPDSELQLELLLEMGKRLELRGSHLSTDQEMEDFSGHIVEHADKLMVKQVSAYQTYKEAHAGLDPLQSMVRFQLDQLLQQVGKEMDKASAAKQQEYIAKVQSFVQSMPSEKQEQIKQRLGVDQLTNEVLQKVVLTSGASVLFAVIVEVSGFAFYTTATSLLASLAGLLGITLSFGAYTALSSVIAVLASPVFLLLLLGGGGYFLYKSQNRKLQNKMLPILILQITLPLLSSPQEDVSYSPLMDVWKVYYDQHQALAVGLREHQSLSDACFKQIISLKSELKKDRQSYIQNESKLGSTMEALKLRLAGVGLAGLRVSGRFSSLADQYVRFEQEAAEIRIRQLKERGNGFLEKVKGAFKSISVGMEISEIQRKQKDLLTKLAQEVVETECGWGQEEREVVRSIREDNRVLRQRISELELNLSEQETKYKSHQSSIVRLKKEKGSLEQRVYGLEHIEQ